MYCQKTKEEILAMRVSCEVCGNLIQPGNLKAHMSASHSENLPEKTRKKSKQLFEQQIIEGRVKRQAAQKAVSLIHEVTTNDDEDRHEKVKKWPVKSMYWRPNNVHHRINSAALTKTFLKEYKKNNTMKCRFQNCGFTTTIIEKMKRHITKCAKRNPNEYVCRMCLFCDGDEPTMVEHVTQRHLKSGCTINEDEFGDSFLNQGDDEDDEEDDDNDDYLDLDSELEKEENCKKVVKKNYKQKDSIFIDTIKLTINFQTENYQSILFREHIKERNDWILIDKESYDEYLPAARKSMCVQHCVPETSIPDQQGIEHEWKQFDLFTSEYWHDSVTVYVGGPIWALAWVPTPLNLTVDQYLAVSVLKDHDQKFKISEKYASSQMIQFWNFGPLNNYDNDISSEPVLEFCLAHDHGIVWHMEWCPSGCYNVDEESTPGRIGMLALACSDAVVHIYSISLPDNKSGADSVKIYKTNESFRLVMDDPLEKKLGNWECQATKLSWSKAKGHNIIAGGFSNGIVCIWDLQIDSLLLKSEDEHKTITLKPYNIFQAHDTIITALGLHTLHGGKRWLMTGSGDKSSKFWDLEDTSYPITVHKKSLVSDGGWLYHWPSSYTCYDDVFQLGYCVSTVQSVRDYGFKQSSFIPTNSTCFSMTASEWSNGMALANMAGEINALFPHDIFNTVDSDKSLKTRRLMLCYSELVEKNLEPDVRKEKVSRKIQDLRKMDTEIGDKDESSVLKTIMNRKTIDFEVEPQTYEEAQSKYGLVICQFRLDPLRKVPKEAENWAKASSRLHIAPIELYPLMQINRIAWNCNKQAFQYIAAGFNAGFVTLQCTRFMNSRIKV